MDGLSDRPIRDATAWCQQTLKAPIGCVGVGLHQGHRASLTFRPAPVDHGIVFRRTDIGVDIPARFDRVVDTRLATVIADDDARIGTIEHVMAALAGCGIDNAVVEIDGPEPPILDGSASPFVFLLDCAGVVAQEAPRTTIAIVRPVRVSDGDAFAELRPPGPGTAGLDMACRSIFRRRDRTAGAVAPPDAGHFHELARARTFTLVQEIDQLPRRRSCPGRQSGERGGGREARVLNLTGLRMPDEFVRHKLLDAVGDLALAGAQLHSRFIAHRSGHTLNHRLPQALFADRSAWQKSRRCSFRSPPSRRCRAARRMYNRRDGTDPRYRASPSSCRTAAIVGWLRRLERRAPTPPRRWRRSRTVTTVSMR
jgi:UDP-3-O-[3-hydroxymyristoyl] N-acetylglucosamine deacetylase